MDERNDEEREIGFGYVKPKYIGRCPACGFAVVGISAPMLKMSMLRHVASCYQDVGVYSPSDIDRMINEIGIIEVIQ